MTNGTINSAIAPVAAEIIPGRPPVNAIITAIQKDAYKPTIGSTPAIIEKAMASGIKANATTIPARISPRTFENQDVFIFSINFLYSYFIIYGFFPYYKKAIAIVYHLLCQKGTFLGTFLN